MKCPKCIRDMTFLETLTENWEETKKAWTCNYCDLISYIVEFHDGEAYINSRGTYQPDQTSED